MPKTRGRKVLIMYKEHGFNCARNVEMGVKYVIPEALKSAELAYTFLCHAGWDRIFFVNKFFQPHSVSKGGYFVTTKPGEVDFNKEGYNPLHPWWEAGETTVMFQDGDTTEEEDCNPLCVPLPVPL